MQDLRDFTLEELKIKFIELGFEKYKAEQIFLWLNKKNINDFDLMTNLSKNFVLQLKKYFTIKAFFCVKHLKSEDKTEKFLFKLEDGNCIETVLIKTQKRKTLCLSSQVGCKIQCPFCFSGKIGFIRNLKTYEIVNQVLKVSEITKNKITNIVFMGIGEPLYNYENLIKSIKIINNVKGLGIGARKITVSTCGIIPGILKLMNFPLQIELSVSLHATNDKLRNELVPINKKYPLKDLLAICKEYYKKTNRIITLEYIILNNKNDSLRDMERLSNLSKQINAKVNLIEYNTINIGVDGVGKKSSIERCKQILSKNGVNVTIRKSKGKDIMAACGQLVALNTDYALRDR